ncbi:MAG TPA: DUF484 family protein [Gammaproteobacteria bacterium]|nr:DUF484 family protein [Gammaproteobacteria bacterium]
MELELAELRRHVASLKEEARKNEEAWKRAQAREMELLEADKLAVLLERLTEGMRAGYRLEAVTLLLADSDHEIRHLLMGQGDLPESLPSVSFVDRLRELVPEVSRTGRPWLGPFASNEHATVFGSRQGLRSVALLPLLRPERLLGCIGMGSGDPRRFTPSLGTDFLHHLAIIAAFSLESSINRARLVRSGFTDALTGWHNRRYLQARLREELARSSRERTALVCLMVDVDHFKRINDRFGHLAGDEVLNRLAQCMTRVVRSSDVSARYGGEEFVILLPGTGAHAGMALAERLRRAVAAEPFPLRTSAGSIDVSVSVGVAEYRPAEREEGLDAAGEHLLARADAALYEAKAKGRNRVELADCPA